MEVDLNGVDILVMPMRSSFHGMARYKSHMMNQKVVRLHEAEQKKIQDIARYNEVQRPRYQDPSSNKSEENYQDPGRYHDAQRKAHTVQFRDLPKQSSQTLNYSEAMNKEFAGLAPSSTKLQGISRNTITSSELGQGEVASYPVEQDGTRRYTDINKASSDLEDSSYVDEHNPNIYNRSPFEDGTGRYLKKRRSRLKGISKKSQNLHSNKNNQTLRQYLANWDEECDDVTTNPKLPDVVPSNVESVLVLDYRSLGNDGLSSLQADEGIGRPVDSGLIQMTYQEIDDMNTVNKQSLQNIPGECEHIDGNIGEASLPIQKTSKYVEPTLEDSKEKEPLINISLSQDCQHLEENTSEVTLSPIEDYSKTNSIISPCVSERDLPLNEQEVLENSANNRVKERKGNIVFHQSAKGSLSTTEEHTVHNFETLFSEHSSDSARTNFATGTPSSSVLECPSIGTEDQSPSYSGNQSVLSNKNTNKIPEQIEENHSKEEVNSRNDIIKEKSINLKSTNSPVDCSIDSPQIVIITGDDEDNTTPCYETNAGAVPISPEMPCLEPFTVPENVVAICNESDFEMPILNVSENTSLVVSDGNKMPQLEVTVSSIISTAENNDNSSETLPHYGEHERHLENVATSLQESIIEPYKSVPHNYTHGSDSISKPFIFERHCHEESLECSLISNEMRCSLTKTPEIIPTDSVSNWPYLEEEVPSELQVSDSESTVPLPKYFHGTSNVKVCLTPKSHHERETKNWSVVDPSGSGESSHWSFVEENNNDLITASQNAKQDELYNNQVPIVLVKKLVLKREADGKIGNECEHLPKFAHSSEDDDDEIKKTDAANAIGRKTLVNTEGRNTTPCSNVSKNADIELNSTSLDIEAIEKNLPSTLAKCLEQGRNYEEESIKDSMKNNQTGSKESVENMQSSLLVQDSMSAETLIHSQISRSHIRDDHSHSKVTNSRENSTTDLSEKHIVLKEGSKECEIKQLKKRSSNSSRVPETCQVCGSHYKDKAEKIEHVKEHLYHCQQCHIAFNSKKELELNSRKLEESEFKSELKALLGEFVRHRSSRHPRTKEQHHCLLCQRTFPTLQRHQLHLSGHLHRHLETAQRRTIHTLFRLFTGNDCPALTPLSEEEASGVSWFPAEGGAIHFYHQAPPLQIAVQLQLESPATIMSSATP
uniref:C2H2-type domain-containing protein n=1 Tax=Timema monikensis TaxID=170555 RepID=A0A7R9HP28_9NEOP|nr:unnamed protein product [Timema monikensis]